MSIISGRLQQDNAAHLTPLVQGVMSQPTVQVSCHCLALLGFISNSRHDTVGCHWPPLPHSLLLAAMCPTVPLNELFGDDTKTLLEFCSTNNLLPPLLLSLLRAMARCEALHGTSLAPHPLIVFTPWIPSTAQRAGSKAAHCCIKGIFLLLSLSNKAPIFPNKVLAADYLEVKSTVTGSHIWTPLFLSLGSFTALFPAKARRCFLCWPLRGIVGLRCLMSPKEKKGKG
ncbi:hypothetical protein ElyMa_005482900 [Elysia marginata]|uniref:Uncharacterized protein n=1 Tax=Elysia marginata TaxID=1093978 RepID=A0AAV4EQT0_9GAST|nr:hypothetical protein ElyMa_005482900 [Elysia marginata]